MIYWYLQTLSYDTNNKYIVTNMLAKLIFQDHTDQKSGLFTTNSQFQDFYRPEVLFFYDFRTLQDRWEPWMMTTMTRPMTTHRTLPTYSLTTTLCSTNISSCTLDVNHFQLWLDFLIFCHWNIHIKILKFTLYRIHFIGALWLLVCFFQQSWWRQA